MTPTYSTEDGLVQRMRAYLQNEEERLCSALHASTERFADEQISSAERDPSRRYTVYRLDLELRGLDGRTAISRTEPS